MAHIFTVAFVSGRQDLPSDEKAFSLTSFERKAFCLLYTSDAADE